MSKYRSNFYLKKRHLNVKQARINLIFRRKHFSKTNQ